jgi:hypothetical protein
MQVCSAKVLMVLCKGVDKFFKTLAKLASSLVFSLANSKKQLAKNLERVSERGTIKLSPDCQVGLYFYLPILNSTYIWRVDEWLSAPPVLCLMLQTGRVQESKRQTAGRAHSSAKRKRDSQAAIWGGGGWRKGWKVKVRTIENLWCV